MPAVLVTAYQNPDLDGVACAFSYAELLRHQGEDAIAGIFGVPDRESRFVFQHFGIPIPITADHILDTGASIIIVDASELRGLSPLIDLSRVVEVIDHREVNDAGSFPNASIHIELVGAAATLIAERYREMRVPISRGSALALFFAIASNTVNFKARVTTARDTTIAEWLRSLVDIPTALVREMFAFKSDLEKPLDEVLRNDALATFAFGGRTIGIAQLELVSSARFVETQLDLIQDTLKEIAHQRSLDLVFLTCVDVEEGCNRIIVSDVLARQLLERSLDLSFVHNVAKTDNIIMRKEIVPALKRALIRDV